MRRTLAIAAIPLALLLLAAAIRLYMPVPTLVRPSLSPTPTAEVTTAPPTASPSPSPSPSPTQAPTAPPTQPTAAPTPSYVAGDRMLPFYFAIRPLFPAMPPTPVILFDADPGVDENASFQGLDAQGQPKFSVRHDFVMDKGTSAHEMGHAYQKVLERQDPSRDYLALYWAFRGFPGTWQQAQAQSDAQASFIGKWTLSPYESWAEAFRAGVMLDVNERTLNYGKTIEPPAMRSFFQSLPKK